MMMVLVSGAQNFGALLHDYYDWEGYSPQPPSLILVPHRTVEDILASGVEDRRLTVDAVGTVKLKGIPVLCLCAAASKLPEFDCPVNVTTIADEEIFKDEPRTEPATVTKKAAKPRKR